VHLVSRSHVERNWDPDRQRWWRRYAYPISDEVWTMWSDDPDEWKPINHSCDPNAWFDGLDLVARHAIPRGARITLDYATLFAEGLEPFACHCETPHCRGVVRGSDYLLPAVRERYGEHVTDYIRRKRAQANAAARAAS